MLQESSKAVIAEFSFDKVKYVSILHVVLEMAKFCSSNPINMMYLTVSAAMAATFLTVRLPLVVVGMHPWSVGSLASLVSW